MRPPAWYLTPRVQARAGIIAPASISPSIVPRDLGRSTPRIESAQQDRVSATFQPLLRTPYGQGGSILVRGKPLSDDLLRALVENSYDGVALAGPDGTRLYISPALPRLLGYTSEEYAEIPPFQVVHEDDREMMTQAFRRAAERPGSIEVADVRLRHKDDSLRFTECVISNRLDEPEIQALVINWRDITARKRAEDELRAMVEVLQKTDDERRLL